MKGMYDEAIQEYQKDRSLGEYSSINADALICGTYAFLGKVDEARSILNHVLERSKKGHISKYLLSGVYFTLGETGKAFELNLKEHDRMLFSLTLSPLLDYMRSDPRAKAVLKKMNLDK